VKVERPLPHGVATKYNAFDRAGRAAAWIEARLGLSIGVGGSPVWILVLYGEGELIWEFVSGEV
jgi:hypothetical protein